MSFTKNTLMTEINKFQRCDRVLTKGEDKAGVALFSLLFCRKHIDD